MSVESITPGGRGSAAASSGAPAADRFGSLATLGGSEGGQSGAPCAAPDAPLERGTAVGRYLIVDRVGIGAMGVVYAAFDPALDRKIALKLLRPRSGGEAATVDARERLAREARAMARLDHPNVVTVHDVGTFGTQVFLAMEFIEGSTLREWLRTSRPWTSIVEVFLAAGEGLAAAHEAGLVHRDFKPDNVMVSTIASGTPRVRVMDFGLARSHAELDVSSTENDTAFELMSNDDVRNHPLTRTGAILGTPAYMAPEQFASADASAAADQFAFCVALHEALFGQPPFCGDNLGALIAAVTEGERRPLPPSRVPRAVLDAIDRGLAIDPLQRWPQMRGLLDRLRRLSGRSRSGWLSLAAGATVLAVLGVAMIRGETDPCPASTDALHGIWDASRQQAIEAAIVDTKLPYAAKTWTMVRDHIDPWTQSWIAARVDACRATHVRHEQSDSILDRRIACLDRRLDDVAAVLDALETGGMAAVESAPELVGVIRDITACADLDALTADVAPPENADERAEAERIRGLITRVMVSFHAGDLPAARAHAEVALTAAHELGYPPILAEAELSMSEIFDAEGRTEQAIDAAGEAVWIAHAAGHDVLEAHASISMVGLLAEHRAFDEVDVWVRHARADVGRLSGDRTLPAQLLRVEGGLARARERFGDARIAFAEAERLCLAREEPLDCLGYTLALGQVEHDAGNFDTALAYYQRTLDVERSAFGDHHPRLGATLNNLATLLRAMGRLDDARANLDEAVAIFSAVDPEHAMLTRVYNNRAVVYLFDNELDAAERDFRAALAGLRREVGDHHPMLPGVEGNIALVVFAQGRYEESLVLQRKVLGETLAIYGEDNLDVASTVANIGDILGKLGRYEEAGESFRRALRIREKVAGIDHADTARTRCSVGEIELEQGRPKAALAFFEQCRDAHVKTFGADDPQVAAAEMSVGLAQLALERTAEGTAQLERALVLASRADGDTEVRAKIQLRLGATKWDAGIDRERARAMVAEAERLFRDAGALYAGDARECAAWLRAHPN